MNVSDQIKRADGFLDLGMHQEAWDTLEELPPIDRTEPLVLELRLRILTAMEKWELGEGIANILLSSAVELQRCRETVARFHYARARELCSGGDYEAARKEMRKASDAWPDIRMELVDDERLDAALWGG